MFRKARVVSAAEVAFFLDTHTADQRKTNASYEAHPETSKTLDYCKKFSSSQSSEVLSKLREVISTRQVTEYHLGMILNLLPESVEELKALIPALDVRPSPPLSPLCRQFVSHPRKNSRDDTHHPRTQQNVRAITPKTRRILGLTHIIPEIQRNVRAEGLNNLHVCQGAHTSVRVVLQLDSSAAITACAISSWSRTGSRCRIAASARVRRVS